MNKRRRQRQRRSTKKRGDKRALPREQYARDNNHQQVKHREVSVLQHGRVHDARDHHNVAGDLQGPKPGNRRQLAHQNQLKDSDGDPENDDRQEIARDMGGRDILWPDTANEKDQPYHHQADSRQPV
jgi:hypothetical protein